MPTKRLDPGLFVAALLATLAAWPFLTRVSLQTYTDAELHAYRVIEIIQAWRAGVPYLRWAPDLFYGYGYPVFHYYAPLTYYLGAAYGWFTDAAAGVKFVLVASAYVGAAGMYLYVRDRWGSVAGVVSAAAFIFAPYLVYIDPHARGDSPETFALALAPGLFWAFGRLRRTPSAGHTALAALWLAALILSHNLMALIFFGVLLGWLAWEMVFDSPAARWNGLGLLAAAIVLGLMLSAFMWLPAVLERNAVQFRNVAGGTYFDFRRYFIAARELFAPILVFDLGATQMRFNHNLGMAQWILGGLGLLSIFLARVRRATTLFFALAAAGFIFFMLPVSLPIWEAIPPLAYLQFPTRLLGPAAVMLAVLAGASVTLAERWKHGSLVLGALTVALCIGAVMPLLYPPLWPTFGAANPQRILDTELDGRGIGTTSANDFLPIGVISVPSPQKAVVDSYTLGQPDKLNRATLPEGASATQTAFGPEAQRWRVSSPTEFVFRVFTFYFPGWTAYVDGVKTPIELSQPEGWITFWIPAGNHEVRLRLENTPPRWLGWTLSGLALAALLGLGHCEARFLRRSNPVEVPQGNLPSQLGVRFAPPVKACPDGLARVPRDSLAKTSNAPSAAEFLVRPAFWLLSAVIVLGIGMRAAADRQGWWRMQSTGNEVLVAGHQSFAALEGNVALLAFDLPQTSARPGAKVPVTLYWKAQAKVTVNLRVFIHFIGSDGQLWGQSDKWNPADFPTSRFPLDLYVRDEHEAALASDAPPGRYTVIAGLWDADTNQRMHVLDADGHPTDADSVVLTTEFEVK